MNRLSVGWGALLTTLSLFGCAGKAQDSRDVVGGGGGLTSICRGATGGTHEVAMADAGEGGVGGTAFVEPQLLHTCGWDATVSVKRTDRTDLNLPSRLGTLVVDDSAALTGLLSVQGQVTPLALIRDSGTRAHLETSKAGIRFADFVLQTLTLTAFDDDSDGIADRLEGSGEGTVDTPCGDCAPVPVPASFTLSAVVDRTAPKVGAVSQNMSPLSQVSVTVSEALQSATLALSGTNTVPLEPLGRQLSSFATSMALPFGGSWQVTGKAQDFAGLALDLSGATLTTMDLGVFAEDGFESQPVASLGATASWIDASSGLPIPTGSRALLLQYATLFHLKRSDGTTKVAFRVIGLTRAASGTADSAEPAASFRAAVIGGTSRVDEQASAGTAVLPTSHAAWTLATEPRTVEFELHDPGTDVAVEISAAIDCSGAIGFGGCTPRNALIIDDLRVE
ncbi:MAG TPA: hypothetical protein VER96_06600 [Polyangiaceae bacterium]|nr:hypothetical protein [Polyangiaceae bacterium]